MKLPRPTDITSLAKLILSDDCKSICILTGAGVSTNSGIPDFRSPGGMYDSLKPDLITATPNQRRMMEVDPTYVVEKGMFFANAFPYLEVRRPFILGTRDHKWKATIAHRFVELLHTKTGKLTRLYTQNIDGLNRQCTDLPAEKIVNVHGSLSEVACEGCGADMDFDEFCSSVKSKIKDIYKIDPDAPKESSPIKCTNCNKPLVKPRTVLFGGSLPSEFFEKCEEDLPSADLLIVAGTSLVVSPANSLVHQVSEDTVRVIVNNQPVGMELGIDYNKDNELSRDFFAQGECDKVFLDLVEELGWIDDLQAKTHQLPLKSQDLLKLKMSLNKKTD